MPHEYSDELARWFGQNLVAARNRAGLSQEELGFQASLHRTEIGQLERGIRLPRLDTIIKLAGALGLPSADLLEGMVWEPPESFATGRWIARGSGEEGA